ncbi:AAA family ATPase [Kamptonema cortianum]|nr:AAA family ATPase [Geitlerinema splendidum]MDK3162143.1 AAA family ATPase [Kamptonema cortianum]
MQPDGASQLQQILDKVEDHAKSADPQVRAYLAALREEIKKTDRKTGEQAELIAQYEEAYTKLTSPANKIGLLSQVLDDGNALITLGDTEYVATIDPSMEVDDLKPGTRIRLNEAYAIVGTLADNPTGGVVKVAEVMEEGRIRVGGDIQGQSGKLVILADSLSGTKIRPGDDVRLDAAGRMAVEHFPAKASQEYFIEEIPETPWKAVGGQQEAIDLIKETIEQPLLHPEIYARFDKKPVKGILLYGPPGCGKTLLGKAVAYNLAKEYSEQKGDKHAECFMHISGPKILNMWLGESERIVREIFSTAREKAKEGQLVVIFLDEAESILRTRSSGRWLNISNTVVPQFCAEMDGLVELENVVLVLTSNRPDYIDPAILRPERIDRKIRVRRPDMAASREIFSIYIHEKLPIDPELSAEHDGDPCGRKALIEASVAALWRESKETEFLRIQTRDGNSKVLYWKDMASGALIKSVVDRAKDTAIRRAISAPSENHGLRINDLTDALAAEYRENEIFPKSDAVEDWLKLLDLEPESVVSVKPISPAKQKDFLKKGVV